MLKENLQVIQLYKHETEGDYDQISEQRTWHG